MKRPLPNGFSKLQYTPCFLHALKTLHVNQMTDMTGDFDDVVRARLHEVHGVARCTYQILCLDMRNKIAACTKWLDTSHQGPTFFSIGTTTFKPASAQAPVKRQHPAKISMMNDKPIVAVRTPVPKNSARVQASAEIFGSGSAATSAATSIFATGTFGSPVSPEHTVLTFLFFLPGGRTSSWRTPPTAGILLVEQTLPSSEHTSLLSRFTRTHVFRGLAEFPKDAGATSQSELTSPSEDSMLTCYI